MKALGVGLTRNLRALNLHGFDVGWARAEGVVPPVWARSLPGPPGHVAACAVAVPPGRVQMLEISGLRESRLQTRPMPV